MVIITLPAYNEEAALPALLLRVKEAMEENGFDYRVIVVNDGSSDGTAAAVDALRGKLPLERIDHPQNRGLGEAVRTGLLRALERADDRDVIVTMDSDNTHTPGLIARHGERHPRGQRRDDRLALPRRRARDGRPAVPERAVARRRACCSALTFPTAGVRDFTSGYRAYRAGLLRRAFDTYGEDFVARERLRLHGRHPAEAAPARRDHERAAADPPLRLQVRRLQDARAAHRGWTRWRCCWRQRFGPG